MCGAQIAGAAGRAEPESGHTALLSFKRIYPALCESITGSGASWMAVGEADVVSVVADPVPRVGDCLVLPCSAASRALPGGGLRALWDP